jgi:hypothetical protein
MAPGEDDMAIRMLWFLPVGILTGLGGTNLCQYLRRKGERRYLADARLVLVLAWLPLIAWLLNQVFTFER